MKCIILFIVVCLVSRPARAQVFQKHHAITLPLSLAAGMAEGYSQVLAFHYYEFDRVHPNVNPQYWNPELSWENKYKNGDPAQGAKFFGSTTFLVFTTDGYHMTRTVSRGCMIGAVIPLFGYKPHSHWDVIREFVFMSAAYMAGFHLVWSVIY